MDPRMVSLLVKYVWCHPAAGAATDTRRIDKEISADVCSEPFFDAGHQEVFSL